MRSAVVVRELAADEGVGHLRRLQGASFVRIANRGGPRLVHRHDSCGDPVEGLIDAGVARTVAAFVNDECVSASVFTTFNQLAYLMLAGHDAKALETQAPTLVLWEMSLRFRAEGFTRLNLGGCGIDAVQDTSPEHGVYAYKKGFGGTLLECASGEKTLRPTVHRVSNLVRAMVR